MDVTVTTSAVNRLFTEAAIDSSGEQSMIRQGVQRGVQVVLVLVFVSFVAGHVLGQPILFGFVETGSMEPTIETGDGFVAIPTELAGEPEPGDVVVFDAKAIQGGGLTTHRVVDETDRGYITRGDANPFLDQDGDEPPVQDSQIVATAWQPESDVVTIPHLGTAIMTIESGLERAQTQLAATLGTRAVLETSGLASLLLAVSVGLYVLETIRERRQASLESRLGRDAGDSIEPRLLVAGVTLLVVVAASAAMVAPAGTHSYDVVSAEYQSDRPLVIEQGTTDDILYPVPNTGFVPIIAYVESDAENVAVEPEREAVGPRDESEVTVSITAPDETGYYPTAVTEYRYLHVLPLPVLEFLYNVHPWLPVVGVNAVLGGAMYGVGRAVLGARWSHRARTKRSRADSGVNYPDR